MLLFARGWLAVLLLLSCSSSLFAQLADVTQPGDPIVGTSNNTPGSEGVANAIDNQPTKYLNFDKLNTGFTVTPRVGLTVVQCLSLTSANDAPERDPASYTLEGSYDGTNFTLISSGPVPAFTNRFDKVVIRFENNTPYIAYRLIFPTVANEGAANSMQIAEVELLGFLAPTDVTQPGDPIVATSNNSPGSEGVANAIDNQPTKYLNFDRLNTGFTVTPAVGGTLVSGITLTSANDAPERDPVTYTLEGSLDGTSFFPIASGGVPAFPTRFYKNYIFFSNDRAYRAYRLIFPTVGEPNSCCMQIAEVELLGVVSDLSQDVTQPGDPIVGTSNNTPGSEGVANAIDNQPTKYLNFDKLNTGFTVTPGSGLTIVNGLTLTSANDAPERDPASYDLSGSYDGTNFTLISSGSVPAFTNRFQKQTILFQNKIPYLRYRLIFPTVANEGAANSMQISEVELLGVLAPTDVTVPGDPIVATSNNSPGSEGVANAIDNQPTKYLNFDRINTGFTVTPSVGDTIVSGLTLTSANDAPERDPTTYTLEGSNDGTEFVAVSSGSVPPFPTRFYKNYIFFPNNTKSFKSYRLIFPTVGEPNSCCMQIAEVELLGVTPGVVNTNPVSNLIARQPTDTPVLLGSSATFRVGLTGPWKVQWYRNGVAIPGATTPTYTTPPTTAADDGALYHVVVQGRDGRQISDEVMLSIFTPSTVKSIGLNWIGGGANGAPTEMLPTDITGFHLQAYWNNLAGGSGTLATTTNSDNVVHPTITVNWAASGEWGVGTGEDDPTQRMLNGMITSASTSEAGAQTVTFSGVPAGNHSVFLYTVQVPQEFFNMDFIAITHDAGGADVVQRRFIRPQNSDEYNPSPGFSLVTADTAAERGVGNMMRFDNLQPGPDGIIQIKFYSPGRVDLPGGDPIRGPGLNALQLVLDAPASVAPPVITRQPASANGLAGGCITLSVEATGPNLTYQWLKNGQTIAGATDSQLTLANLSTNDAGNYTVIVSNPAGRVSSRTAVVGVVSSAQVTLGLITYFKFDEADLTTPVAANSAPGGQPGQVGGVFPATAPGQIGNALIFDQDFTNHVFVPTYPKVTKTITISGWVNASTDQWGPLVNNWIEGRTTGQSGQFLVEVIPVNGVPTLQAQIEVGPNRALASAPIDATLSVWHHFAVSANGSSLSIYWDGQLVNTVDYLGNINMTPSIPWLSIGANLNGDPMPALIPPLFVGQMDDLAIWNRSLSDLEIRGIYSAGLSGVSVSDVAPILVSGACPPTIACSANIVAECTGGLTPVTYTVTAVDSAGAPVAVVCVPPSGSGFRLGQSNVTCTATSGGVSASCTFRVTVVDTLPPVVTCSSNITVSATSPSGAVVTYIASATDPCGIASFECTPPPGSTFPIGATTVTCTAVDGVSNTISCSFTVTVNAGGNQCPTANPSNITVSSGASANFQLSASDPESNPLTYTVTQAPAHGTVVLQVQTGAATYTPAAGYCGPDSFRFRVNDGTCNSGEATVAITVDCGSNQPPANCTIALTPTACVISNGATLQIISLDGEGALVTPAGSATDPDGDVLTFTWQLDGAPFVGGATLDLAIGCHQLTLTVSDGQASCSTSVQVCVITADDAVNQCVQLVNDTPLQSKNKRPLLATLKAAMAAFADGRLEPAMNQLDAFQNKVRAQLGTSDPAAAQAFIDCAARINDAVVCSFEQIEAAASGGGGK
jgi:hypothetical protein